MNINETKKGPNIVKTYRSESKIENNIEEE